MAASPAGGRARLRAPGCRRISTMIKRMTPSRRDRDGDQRHQRADRRDRVAVLQQRRRPARDQPAAAVAFERNFEQRKRVGQQQQDRGGDGEGARIGEAARRGLPQSGAAAPAQEPAGVAADPRRLGRSRRNRGRRAGFRASRGQMFCCALAVNTRIPGLRSLAGPLISGASVYRLWRYTAYGISVADPGAVPGASTNPALLPRGRNRLDARGKGKIRRPA